MTGTLAAVQPKCRTSTFRSYRPVGRKVKYGPFSFCCVRRYRNLHTKDSVKIDPCCGTVGFLLAAYEHMRKQIWDEEKQRFLKNNALFGADNTSRMMYSRLQHHKKEMGTGWMGRRFYTVAPWN